MAAVFQNRARCRRIVAYQTNTLQGATMLVLKVQEKKGNTDVKASSATSGPLKLATLATVGCLRVEMLVGFPS